MIKNIKHIQSLFRQKVTKEDLLKEIKKDVKVIDFITLYNTPIWWLNNFIKEKLIKKGTIKEFISKIDIKKDFFYKDISQYKWEEVLENKDYEKFIKLKEENWNFLLERAFNKLYEDNADYLIIEALLKNKKDN